jgi:hypothetical protein
MNSTPAASKARVRGHNHRDSSAACVETPFLLVVWQVKRASPRRRLDLFGSLDPLTLAKAYAWTATVLVDEFDPCGNKGSFNLLKRRRVAGVSTDFNVIDCIPMKARCLGQVPNSPV